METWSSHNNVKPWVLNWKIRSSEHHNIFISVRELRLWEQLQKRKCAQIIWKYYIIGTKKQSVCERERLSWLQSEVQMAVRFTQSTRLTWDGITPLFSFTHGFAWPLLFLCETILAKSSSVLDNILLTRIVIKTGQTGQSSGSPTLHRPAPGHTTWGAFIFLGGRGANWGRDSFKWTL